MKRSFALLLCLVLCMSLCACGKTAPAVTFTAAGATGYQWEGAVADETIATMEASTETSDSAVAGAPLSYVFTFAGVAAGETTATFTFGRSWEAGFVQCDCAVTVDEKLQVTLGELSEKTLVLDPGSVDYTVLCFDDDVTICEQDGESGVCTFSAVGPGTTRVDFFYRGEDAGEEDASFTDLAYDITVDEEGMFYWAEALNEDEEASTGFVDYTKAADLASDTSLFVPELKEMKSCKYTYLEQQGLAYVTFRWDDVPVVYAAGAASLDGLTDETTVEKTIAGTTVYVTTGSVVDPASQAITAVWQNGSAYCFLVSEDEGFTSELMETVLTAMIEAQNA